MTDFPVDTRDFTTDQKNMVHSVFVELLHKAGVTYDALTFKGEESKFVLENPSCEIKIPPALILEQLKIDDELRRLNTENNPD